MNKLQSKAALIVKLHGLDSEEKILDIFSSMREHNTSCHICKFCSTIIGCKLSSKIKSLNYIWKDSISENTWCIAWLDPKNRKKEND